MFWQIQRQPVRREGILKSPSRQVAEGGDRTQEEKLTLINPGLRGCRHPSLQPVSQVHLVIFFLVFLYTQKGNKSFNFVFGCKPFESSVVTTSAKDIFTVTLMFQEALQYTDLCFLPQSSITSPACMEKKRENFWKTFYALKRTYGLYLDNQGYIYSRRINTIRGWGKAARLI